MPFKPVLTDPCNVLARFERADVARLDQLVTPTVSRNALIRRAVAEYLARQDRAELGYMPRPAA